MFHHASSGSTAPACFMNWHTGAALCRSFFVLCEQTKAGHWQISALEIIRCLCLKSLILKLLKKHAVCMTHLNKLILVSLICHPPPLLPTTSLHSNNPAHRYYLATDPVTGQLYVSDTNSRRIYRPKMLSGARDLISKNALPFCMNECKQYWSNLNFSVFKCIY